MESDPRGVGGPRSSASVATEQVDLIMDGPDGGITEKSPIEGREGDGNTVELALTRPEKWNLLFCLLSWACTTAAATLVVGSSNLILVYIGAPESHSALALGTFFVGASFVSILVPFFARSKPMFLSGTGLGLLGAFAFGIPAVYAASEALFLVASCLFGASMGLGLHLRFAALGVVAGAHHKAFAMTLVVSGGCLAAFAGPEAAQGTIYMIPKYPYMGTMCMTGIFHALNALFILLVRFPGDKASAESKEMIQEEQGTTKNTPTQRPPLYHLFHSRSFLLPMLLSSSSWAAMAMPMGVVRVAMGSVGYASRRSLLVMELHFLGMYAPGFVTGRWIQSLGFRPICRLGCAVFLVALVLLQCVRANDAFALWAVGMVCVGIGWNFVFTSSTVWLSKGKFQKAFASSSVQAAHDFLMFLLSGAWILSASFLYAAGGGQYMGWGLLLWVVLGIVGFMVALLVFDFIVPPKASVVLTGPLEQGNETNSQGAAMLLKQSDF